MVSLVHHPTTPCAVVDRLTAEITVGGDALVIIYRIVGRIEELGVPTAERPLDPERLWEHTCCELFVATGGESYVEWNFSPTGQSARFEFESYRQRRPSPPGPDAPISVAVRPDELQLQARVPLPPDLAAPARLSLTAVVEDVGGGISYFALRHPGDRPDFHHPGGFTLALTLNPSPAIVDAPVKSP